MVFWNSTLDILHYITEDTILKKTLIKEPHIFEALFFEFF